jgi:hypothetical protein
MISLQEFDMGRSYKTVLVLGLVILLLGCQKAETIETILVPEIDGEWWEVTGNPKKHKYATERQEPVDFAV